MVIASLFVELVELKTDEPACFKALAVSHDVCSEGYVL